MSIELFLTKNLRVCLDGWIFGGMEKGEKMWIENDFFGVFGWSDFRRKNWWGQIFSL